MPDSLDQFSARSIDDKSKALAKDLPGVLVSADSHAQEPPSLVDDLPSKFKDRIPPRHGIFKRPEGSSSCDPKLRVRDMDLDKVTAEVLYPDRGLGFFHLDQDVQEAIFPRYNDWLADFCKAQPKRLFGITAVSAFDIDKAIEEMQRGHDLGLHGALIWEVPHPSLPYTSTHYEKLYAAAVELDTPIHVHILTGYSYHMKRTTGVENMRGCVNTKTHDTMTTLFDFIWTGVFERHPKLKLQLVESEIGWLPFVLQQWDYYYGRFTKPGQSAMQKFAITRKPSEIFNEHFYATFMDDAAGAHMLKVWGEKNCMWSSDYPHANMTWPNSRAFLAKQMAGMEPARIKRFVSQNVIDLYKLKL